MENKKKLAGQVALILGLILVGATAVYPNEVAGALATIIVDSTAPDIYHHWPFGSETYPTPLELNSTITLTLDIIGSGPESDTELVWCDILRPDMVWDQVIFSPDQGRWHWQKTYAITQEGKYRFVFNARDWDLNTRTVTGWGEIGDAQGDFYMVDGDDPEWILVTKDATVRFNHKTLNFKFIATKWGSEVVRVWIEVLGYTTFDLSESITDTEWTGPSWTAPSDGAYTINGYFKAYGKVVQAMSISGGINEEPVTPRFPRDAWIAIGIGSVVSLIGGLVWYKYPDPE